MATFEERVEGVTGFTITGSATTPNHDELTEFLRDGVLDVTSRWIAIKPEQADLFMRETATTATNGYATGGAQVISVIRENASDGDTDGSLAWRECRKVPASFQSRVVDSDSFHYASRYNPAYIIDTAGTVNVYPTPDGTDDGYRIFYVNEEPRDVTNNANLAYNHSDINYFPNDKIYLVVLYASIRSLEAMQQDLIVDKEDVELTQAIQVLIANLKQEYDIAFTAPLQAAKAQGG